MRMFKEKLITLDLNKQLSEETGVEPETIPKHWVGKSLEQIREYKEVIRKWKEERSAWLIQKGSEFVNYLKSDHLKDYLMNIVPISGEWKAFQEVLSGKTFSGKELSPFEQAVWASIPMFGTMCAIQLIQGEHGEAALTWSKEIIMAKLQFVLLTMNAKDIVKEGYELINRSISQPMLLLNNLSDKVLEQINKLGTTELRPYLLSALEALRTKSK